MNKYKVGDKVIYNGVHDEIDEIVYVGGKFFGYDLIINNIWPVKEKYLQPYKTPHQELLDLGFNFWNNSNGLQYDRKEIGILIDKETKTYKVYWVVDDMAFSVDLQLAKILVRYLEELE